MWWLMKKKLIFDIGAHKGEDTRFYLRKGFRVVAVEAYPHHAQHIQEQLADDILCGDLVVEQVGIGETRGLGKFFVHETQRWSHFLRQPAKVDSTMQRTIHHEDAETVFGGVQGQGRT